MNVDSGGILRCRPNLHKMQLLVSQLLQLSCNNILFSFKYFIGYIHKSARSSRIIHPTC